MTVPTRRNKKFPDKQMTMFTVGLFDEEFKKLSERRIPLGVSINVNADYWADARDNLVINKAPYPQGT
ncbi:MAG: hypothetical protein LBG52_07920 [Candidatus Peribacteria bacterium]|jgi:hypothetical protein|nr:hypothetical protein [Candidatus Peribacteria bacterium]